MKFTLKKYKEAGNLKTYKFKKYLQLYNAVCVHLLEIVYNLIKVFLTLNYSFKTNFLEQSYKKN